MKLELVSHPLCPFVQRSAILLQEKNVAVERRNVDLKSKPDWFLAMSPRGKVPLLVADGTVLFESAIINEFLDETHPPRILAEDPIRRAKERAWVVVADDLFLALYKMVNGATEHDYNEGKTKCEAIFARLEAELASEFLAGAALGLVDIAFAPACHRFAIVERWSGTEFFAGYPKVDAWARHLAARPSTKASVADDFENLYLTGIRNSGGWLTRLVA